MYLRRTRTACCPGCGSPHAARHAAACGLLRVARALRAPTPYVTARDTHTLPCGCSDLLVRQFGGWGHRVDHSEPDAPRPPAFDRDELAIGAALLIAAVAAIVIASTDQPGSDARVGAAAVAAVVILAIVATTALRLSHRPARWPGRKSYRAGEPGRYVPCTWCAGDGVEFAPAYPNATGPAHTTPPDSSVRGTDQP